MTFSFVALVVLLGSAPRSGPGAVSMCSLVPFAAGRDSSTTFFVGTPRPDTVLAGPGVVRFELRPGHWGKGKARIIYGQVVHVGRLGGAGAAAIERAFARRGSREVVVVPWDYDPGCETVPWGRSARWVTAPTPGFYTVRLRTQPAWAGDRPTFDAFAADFEPYPHGPYFARGYARAEDGTDPIRAGALLTPVEYFDLYAALPDQVQRTHTPAAALASVRAWERAHPDLVSRFPANQILRYARRGLERR